MCAPSMPSPPDPVRTAAAQGTINNETAYTQNRLNQTNQSTPYGTLEYVPTGEDFTYNRFNQTLYDERAALRLKNGQGGAPDSSAPIFNTQVTLGPKYEAVTSLTPAGERLQQGQMDLQQGTLDTANQQLSLTKDALGQPLNFDGLPEFQGSSAGIADAGRVNYLDNDYAPNISGSFDAGRGPQYAGAAAPSAIGTIAPSGGIQGRVGADDFGDDRMRVEQALMDRMQPYLDQRRDAESTRLANMGFTDRRSDGYRESMDLVNRQENDARLGAIINAGNEQSRLFGMDLAAGQFGNQAQGQRFSQNMAQTGVANAAIQQDYGNQLARAGFNNQAAGQQFGQNMAERGFTNDAMLQRLGAEATAAGFNNQAQAQQYGQNVTEAQFAAQQAAMNNAARQQAIQERMLLRQTPLNEISAINSGTQVQQPNFVNTPQANIQAPDYQGAAYASYQGDLANAQARAQHNQMLTQGLFSLGGSALGAFGATSGFGFLG